ncbi:MAG: hypothetical protein Tsb0013_15290 [Phycisphaerales bacterium]
MIITRDVPTLDRWNYPFNFTPGTRTAASVFGVVGAEVTDGVTFDQRDAQFLIGFDLQPEVAAAMCDPQDLVVTQAVVTVTVSNNNNFVYDDSQDSFTSHLPLGTPGATVDTDPGRPIELFGVGYRGGFDQSTFVENSPFGAVAWEGRNAFPIDFDANGDPRDVSNNVSGSPTGIGPLDPFEPNTFAVGTIDTLTPGDLVPANSVVSFSIDVSDPDVQQYLRDALVSGELRVMVTSLQFASFQTMEGAFASLYTKENIFATGRTATLSLIAECAAPSGCAADFDMDGDVDLGDFGAFGAAFGTSAGDPNFDPNADFDNDGDVDLGDFGFFGAEFGRTDC